LAVFGRINRFCPLLTVILSKLLILTFLLT
jgi:hypothetical protein